ncbi:hypothetical protein [Clostridium paraputrificum]|uniref:hypothetical protein n=1 Tax=Clostridium paraputrificum TaxID=29363 RepID=UPI0004033C73|nr:hypothetical protein [Clostridium paraputrificum]MDB2124334.1 hypothetical protein [Clostridium paraputrificum]
MEEKDIRDIIEKEINEGLKKYLNRGIKKVNLHTIFQVIWMFELYYLGANSIYEFAINNAEIKKLLNNHTIALPKEIEMYNNIIKDYFASWSGFVIFFAIAMIVCGLFFAYIRVIPRLSDYMLIYRYSVYGIEAGMWLIFIYATYLVYLKFGVFFILIPMFVSICIMAIEKLKEYLGI